MSNRNEGSIINALKLVNNLAYRSGKKLYAFYLVINLVLVINTFVALYLTEYTVNAAYYLFVNKKSFNEIFTSMLLFLVVTILFLALNVIKNILRNKLLLSSKCLFESEINNKLGSIEWEYYERNDTFVKIHDVKTKTFSTIQQMLDSIVLYITTIPLIFVYGYYLVQINVSMVVAYIIMFAYFNGIVAKKLYKKIGDMWRELQVYNHRGNYYFSMIGDRVSHQEYKFNRLFEFTFNRWHETHDKEFDLTMKISKKHELALQSARIMMSIPYILMLAFVVYEISIGKHEIGFLILINKVLNNIVSTVMNIQNSINSNRLGVMFIKRYKDILRFKDEHPHLFIPKLREIVLKEVTYTYPQSTNKVLNSLSLSVKSGEKVALLGHNGCGKTTLVNLLMSLTSNYQGEITNGSKRIDLRGAVSCIFQDFAQYQMTIKENIEMGFVEHSFNDDEIMYILHRVGLSELIEKLEKGIYTSLGQLDNGIEMSKGQWQRLAIARLIANPNTTIWILDEPTSHLDPLSEIEVYNLINNLAGDRTVFFISHRLGFARNADRIIVLENGQVKESGDHQSLMKINGLYASMYEIQKNWYNITNPMLAT